MAENAFLRQQFGLLRRRLKKAAHELGEERLSLLGLAWWVLQDKPEYFNVARPHQRLGQRIPLTVGLPVRDVPRTGRIVATPVLTGLHHDYRRDVDGPPDGAVIAGRRV